MPEPLTIYAAVTGSLGAINIIKTWIQELRRLYLELDAATDTLDALNSSCETSKCFLELWMKMWEIDENVPSHYARELWGSRSSEVLLQHLGYIKRLQEDVTLLISKVVGETSKETLRNLEIIMAVEPKAKKKLGHITTYVERLKQLSKEAFEVKHGKKMDPENSGASLQAFRNSVFFGNACSSRTLWRKLYESCRQAMESWRCDHLKLELDVFAGTLDATVHVQQITDPLRLKYSFLFPSVPPVGLGEFAVEGPILVADPSKLDAKKSLYMACCDALRNQNSSGEFFRLQADGAEWFGASVPPKRLCPPENLSRIHDLKSILYPLTVTILHKPLHRFPRSERIRFAFKVAQCGIFLCGTPWLFDLKTNNIRSLRDGDRNRHYLLETKATRAITTDGELQHFLNQIYAIGTILAEVGLGKTITHLPIIPDQVPRRAFQIGKEKLTVDDVVAMVEKAMGTEYSVTVRASLHPSTTWAEALRLKKAKSYIKDDKSYHKAVEVYYTSVYCP